MSIRLYIGNLPQTFNEEELTALLRGIGEGIWFKSVLDRDTGDCRGFGFANVEDPKVADAVIEQLNGKDFGGSFLRVERSERRDSGTSNRRRGSSAPMGAGQPQVARKAANKVVHSDAPNESAPDPRWAGELARLKDLLGNQKTAV
ncbi:RNA-binding protein [Synechococcus sp. M16CYN]|uniref:RNA recognition motif domain-containing protein n=1 Tax=Synechococcus sp. M16CYN TaxID=3103139 RepID=UPI0032539625